MSSSPENLRARFRFSLLTLLTVVLMIAAGRTLWANWNPLAPTYTIHVDNGAEPLFSPQDRYCLLIKNFYDKESESHRRNLEVRETASGKVIYTFPDEIRGQEYVTVYFSPSERFLFIIRKPHGVVNPFSLPPPEGARRTDMVDLQNGKITALHEAMGWECSVWSLSQNEIAILKVDDKSRAYKAVKLPTLEVLADFKDGEFYPDKISAGGDWVIGSMAVAPHGDARTSSIFSIKSKSLLPMTSIHGFYERDFCCGEKYVALSLRKDDSKDLITEVFDVPTRKLVATFDGQVETKRERPGGGQFRGPLQSDANHILLLRLQNTDTWICDYSIGCLNSSKPHAVDISGDMMGFINRDGCVALRNPFGVFNADQNTWLWRDESQNIKLPNGVLSPSGDWIIYDTTESRAPRIVDAQTGRVALEMPSTAWPGTAQSDSQYRVTFCNRHPSFITAQSEASGEKKDGTFFTFWRLNHPLEWYGIAYRPELWIALALLGVLLWSVRRDWRNSHR